MQQLIWRLVATKRAYQLQREYKEIDKLMSDLNNVGRQQLAGLAFKEFAAAAKSEFPHLYGTPPDERYAPWGSGTSIGLSRARSDNPQVRVRGIALWLTVAYHETRGTTLPALDGVHRSLLRSLRWLREGVPQATAENWFSAGPGQEAA